MVEASDTQFFVGDFVSVSWDQNTTITAKIIHFYTKVRSQVYNHNNNMCCISCVLLPFVLQEYTQGVFAEVEALLSVAQFCSCHEIDTCMYYDVDSLVISNRFEVDTSDIVSATQPPSGLLTWDHESGTFECVTIEEYSDSYIFKSIIQTYTALPLLSKGYAAYIRSHPLKAQSLGQPIVVAPLLPYTDDTSGSRSKKWNKFDVWCFMLADLPQKENAKMHNIHFITCSNRVEVLQMAGPVVEDLTQLKRGVTAYDAYLQKEVLLISPVLGIIADNPRHSELLNHPGGSANKYCRICMVSKYEYIHTGRIYSTGTIFHF